MRIAVLEERIVDLIAAIADADIAHANPLVRAEDLRIGKRCDRARSDGVSSGHDYTISDPL
jgi:hypothetical protein